MVAGVHGKVGEYVQQHVVLDCGVGNGHVPIQDQIDLETTVSARVLAMNSAIVNLVQVKSLFI